MSATNRNSFFQKLQKEYSNSRGCDMKFKNHPFVSDDFMSFNKDVEKFYKQFPEHKNDVEWVMQNLSKFKDNYNVVKFIAQNINYRNQDVVNFIIKLRWPLSVLQAFARNYINNGTDDIAFMIQYQLPNVDMIKNMRIQYLDKIVYKNLYNKDKYYSEDFINDCLKYNLDRLEYYPLSLATDTKAINQLLEKDANLLDNSLAVTRLVSNPNLPEDFRMKLFEEHEVNMNANIYLPNGSLNNFISSITDSFDKNIDPVPFSYVDIFLIIYVLKTANLNDVDDGVIDSLLKKLKAHSTSDNPYCCIQIVNALLFNETLKNSFKIEILTFPHGLSLINEYLSVYEDKGADMLSCAVKPLLKEVVNEVTSTHGDSVYVNDAISLMSDLITDINLQKYYQENIIKTIEKIFPLTKTDCIDMVDDFVENASESWFLTRDCKNMLYEFIKSKIYNTMSYFSNDEKNKLIKNAELIQEFKDGLFDVFYDNVLLTSVVKSINEKNVDCIGLRETHLTDKNAKKLLDFLIKFIDENEKKYKETYSFEDIVFFTKNVAEKIKLTKVADNTPYIFYDKKFSFINIDTSSLKDLYDRNNSEKLLSMMKKNLETLSCEDLNNFKAVIIEDYIALEGKTLYDNAEPMNNFLGFLNEIIKEKEVAKETHEVEIDER